MLGYLLFIFGLIVASIQYKNSKHLFLVFLVIFLFSAMRYNIGYDYPFYIDLMRANTDYLVDRMQQIEPFSRFLLQFSQKNGFYIFFVITSFLSSFCFWYAIKKSSIDAMSSFWIFIGTPMFFMTGLSIIRNFVALGLIFIAITLCKKKRDQFLFIFLGAMFHSSAWVSLLILLPWNRLKTKYLVISSIVSIFASTLLRNTIIQCLLKNGVSEGETLSYYMNGDSLSGGSINIILYAVLVIICLLSYKYIKENKTYVYYLDIMLVGFCLMMIFLPQPHVALRLSTYFMSPVILLLPYIVYKRFGKTYYLDIVFFLMFLSYVCYFHNSTKDYNDVSSVYPYQTILTLIF